ncbi:hypothetical protein ACFVZH_39960, partial [Streptomyces sp. NPDC059534]|uniref:hypothetical protein n=1 Tax=Streptomyces sp. NPDC059534 TaxID=3346859 RepID=UPI003683004E
MPDAVYFPHSEPGTPEFKELLMKYGPTVHAFLAFAAIAGVCTATGTAAAAGGESSVSKTYYIGTAADGIIRTARFNCGSTTPYVKSMTFSTVGADTGRAVSDIDELNIGEPTATAPGFFTVSRSTPYDPQLQAPPSIRLDYTCSSLNPGTVDDIPVRIKAEGTAAPNFIIEDEAMNMVIG